MQSVTIIRESEIKQTPRVMQMRGIFDVQPAEKSTERWEVNLPLDEKGWNIGLIVGPSGCGKSTIAKELFGDAVMSGYEWSSDKSILDGFPEMSIKEITELLSSVGFSSPPLWLRPFHVLSTGQQMRVNVARLLAENKDLAVMDEFTSVVDRTVAQIGSGAIAKTVRRRQQKFIAVTCHYDVQEWLQPDWVYQPHVNEFLWRFPGRRPEIELEVSRVHYSAWELFKRYHYMSADMAKTARCYVGFMNGEPVVFCGILPAIVRNAYRVSRLVTVPDYQGVGVGVKFLNHIADNYKSLGKRMMITTALPSLYHALIRMNWRTIRAPSLAKIRKNPKSRISIALQKTAATQRLTATFDYVGKSQIEKSSAEALVYGEIRNPGALNAARS